MILVISHPGDPHAARVIEILGAGGNDVVLLDLSDLPDKAAVTIDYDDPRSPAIRYERAGDSTLDLGLASAVWWRRPQVADVSGIGPDDARMFTANEWHEAVNGLWLLLDAPWCNPPALDEIAGRKAHQLRVAADVGLTIPRTLITSDPAAARAFVGGRPLGRTIFKTFSATYQVWRETRLVGQPELASLDAVRMAPVIFQEYIEAAADIRVTIVGDRFFPAAIDATGTDYPVDFRMSLGQAQTAPTELPTRIVERLRALMARLGLVYGAIDLRRTPEGEYVFLEINTAGEFLFIEQRTGQPIAQAMADWLVRPGAPRSPAVRRRRTAVGTTAS